MIHNVLTILALAFVAITASCASVGPINQPQFMPMVEKASGVPQADIAIIGRVSWFPTTFDHCWMPIVSKCTETQKYNRNLLSKEPDKYKAKEGILVTTGSELVILEWDDKNKSYTKDNTLPFRNIAMLEMYKWGLSRHIRLTVKGNEFMYFSIIIMGPYGQQHDAEKNEQLFEHLKSRLPKDSKVAVF